MIPGPIEFEPAVMQAVGMPSTSHVAPDFIESFGRSLEMMREVWLAPSGQPFIMAGSGTLALVTTRIQSPGSDTAMLTTIVLPLKVYPSAPSMPRAVKELG